MVFDAMFQVYLFLFFCLELGIYSLSLIISTAQMIVYGTVKIPSNRAEVGVR
jgi:hypothetical protein